jgi:hypothetical protein
MRPRLYPIRNTLTPIAVAGVMLVAIAGCSAQPLNTRESDALARGVTGPGGGVRTGVVVVTASAGEGRDGVLEAGSQHTVGNSVANSDSHGAAINQSRSLGLDLPQRYLAF